MAKRSSTSKIGRREKGGSHKGTRPALTAQPSKRADNDFPKPKSCEDFEGERTGLMKAEAVLNCLSFALNHSSWNADDGTTYGMAVDVARELVQESTDRLEQRGLAIESRKRRTN